MIILEKNALCFKYDYYWLFSVLKNLKLKRFFKKLSIGYVWYPAIISNKNNLFTWKNNNNIFQANSIKSRLWHFFKRYKFEIIYIFLKKFNFLLLLLLYHRNLFIQRRRIINFIVLLGNWLLLFLTAVIIFQKKI